MERSGIVYYKSKSSIQPLEKSYICHKFCNFFSLKIMAYNSLIFCHKFGDFFSLKIMAYYSVIFCHKFGDFLALKVWHTIV